MKVLVTGGRDYYNYQKLSQVLSELDETNKITSLVNGDASGADKLSSKWAREVAKLEPLLYPAKWDDISVPGALIKYRAGKPYNAAAGPLRNQEMIDLNPDIELCVAFPGGAGTNDMIFRCKRAGIKVLKIES